MAMPPVTPRETDLAPPDPPWWGQTGRVNLRDLEYLVALADHRHFGRAADASFVSQSTLSSQIKKLEAQLGVELVERTTRSVLFTSVGATIAERARAVMAEVEDIWTLARQAAHPESGTVAVGLFPTLAAYLLPHVLGPLRQRFPDLELQLMEEKTDDLLDQLRGGRLDAALLARPVDDSGLASLDLFDEPFDLAAPSSHPLADPAVPVGLESLARERLLLLDEGHCLRDQALDVCRLAGATEDTEFRATSLETLRHMVAAGLGVTLLPRLATSPPVPAYEHLVVRPACIPGASRRVALFWRSSSSLGAFLATIGHTIAAAPLPTGIAPVPGSMVDAQKDNPPT
jgi:LysR family hydrogen peroxide-inducible transcriptional activator